MRAALLPPLVASIRRWEVSGPGRRLLWLLFAGAAVAVGGVLVSGATADASHRPDATLHVCSAGGSGELRVDEECRRNETAFVLATGAGLAAAEDRIAALETDVAALESQVATLESENSDLKDRVAALESLLEGVTRTVVDGFDTLRLAAMNLQVVNGTGSTDGDPNGLGNVIVGYSADRRFGATDPATDRIGSHYLVVGDGHHWTHFGGIVAGFDNTATGRWATVTGGEANTASGRAASVPGGNGNTASGFATAVTGGAGNTASGFTAAVSGGIDNLASGRRASVSGGFLNTASGSFASVTGGIDNTASATDTSVTGGDGNTAAAPFSTVAGGRDGTIPDEPGRQFDSLIGNSEFPDG